MNPVLSRDRQGAERPEIVEAEGVVLLNGKPLPNARVRFCPESGSGSAYTAEGVTDEAGRFKLMCHGQPGAVSGENQVVVMEGEIPPDLTRSSAREKLRAYLENLPNRPIPAIYANVVQTPLTVQVSAAQTNYCIVLKR